MQAYLTAKGEFLWYPLKDKVRRAHVHTHTRTHTRTHHTHARTQHTRTHSGAPRMWKRALDQDPAGGKCLPAMSVRVDEEEKEEEEEEE